METSQKPVVISESPARHSTSGKELMLNTAYTLQGPYIEGILETVEDLD